MFLSFPFAIASSCTHPALPLDLLNFPPRVFGDASWTNGRWTIEIDRAKFVIHIFPTSKWCVPDFGYCINSITASTESLLYPFQHQEFDIIGCKLQVHVSWSYVATGGWKHIYTRIYNSCFCLAGVELLQVCSRFGMFWAAARCRRMPLAMCQKRWRVVPSFSAFRRQWKGRAGNKLFPEFPRYCPINVLIYPFNCLSMHFCFIDFCPSDRLLSSSFWRREQKHLPLTDDDERLKERNLCEKSCCWNYVKGPLAPAWTSNGASFKLYIQHCLLIWRCVCVFQ